MAILTRDPVVAAKQLGEWLTRQFPERGGATVAAVDVPPGSGFSGETLLFDAEWGDGSREALVAKVEPTTHTVFWKPDFRAQYEVQRAISEHTEVPMADYLGLEEDPSVLGAAFYVMGRVEGQAPADAPQYTDEGFVVDAPPDERRRMWESGIDAMAGIHVADWRALGLDFLDHPGLGQTGIDQEIGYCEKWWEWSWDGTPNPVIERAWEWVRANRPPSTPSDEVALCWGDSRPGNLLFHDGRCVAVLDWEMVTLGEPLLDIGWWLFLDGFHHLGKEQRLEGLPDRDELVARWSSRTGRSVDPDTLHFFEVFAGLRFGIVMVRLATLFTESGMMETTGDMAQNNPVTHLLARYLGMPAPGS